MGRSRASRSSARGSQASEAERFADLPALLDAIEAGAEAPGVLIAEIFPQPEDADLPERPMRGGSALPCFRR